MRSVMKTGMDITAPLCAIPFPRVETSEAGPLDIWGPNWLNQGRGLSVCNRPAAKTKEGLR